MSQLQFTIAQINVTIGDIDGNIQRMVTAARQASEQGSQLVVFSELSLCGYHPADLLDEPDFALRLERGLKSLSEATRLLPELTWVVGAPTPRTGPGKHWYNALLALRNGEVLVHYAKQLLPNYNVFDEHRHFAVGPDAAKVLRVGPTKIGFMICEDGWNDAGTDYEVNPFARLRDAAPDLVISINASPSNIGKREQRHQVFTTAARRHGLPLVFVNQVGGHDQLVYDGASFAVEPQAGVVFEAQRFSEDIRTLRFDQGRFVAPDGQALAPVPTHGLTTAAFYRAQIVLGLKDYARRCGFQGAVVGCSGGIDSALTLALAVEALGPRQVTAVTMPSMYSSPGSVQDSIALCANLGITLHHHPIQALVDAYTQQFSASFQHPLTGLALENLQARIRGTVLMAYSNSFGHLLLTTGNKSEISVGYCTLYGDTNGGLGPIGDLYKTEVFALCRHLNASAGRDIIPQAIIDKPPSAELAPGQKDEDSLPPYAVLDDILKGLIEGNRLAPWEREPIHASLRQLSQTEDGRALVERIQSLIVRSEYKRRQAPPILRVRARAFGTGRQMPIAAKLSRTCSP